VCSDTCGHATRERGLDKSLETSCIARLWLACLEDEKSQIRLTPRIVLTPGLLFSYDILASGRQMS
jgi:hypothetical protein